MRGPDRLEILVPGWKLQSWKLRRQSLENFFLYFPTQFLTRGGLKRRYCRIDRLSNEAAAGLGFDAIREMRDQAF